MTFEKLVMTIYFTVLSGFLLCGWNFMSTIENKVETNKVIINEGPNERK